MHFRGLWSISAEAGTDLHHLPLRPYIQMATRNEREKTEALKKNTENRFDQFEEERRQQTDEENMRAQA